MPRHCDIFFKQSDTSFPHSLTVVGYGEVRQKCPNVVMRTSLPHYLTTSLPHYSTTSLPHYLTTSLPHYLPISLVIIRTRRGLSTGTWRTAGGPVGAREDTSDWPGVSDTAGSADFSPSRSVLSPPTDHYPVPTAVPSIWFFPLLLLYLFYCYAILQ